MRFKQNFVDFYSIKGDNGERLQFVLAVALGIDMQTYRGSTVRFRPPTPTHNNIELSSKPVTGGGEEEHGQPRRATKPVRVRVRNKYWVGMGKRSRLSRTGRGKKERRWFD